MFTIAWSLFLMHAVLAGILFLSVNWVGKHAVDFGYGSTTLFEEPNENIALNFFIRALSPAVFIIIISAVFVTMEKPNLRLGIFMIAPYYYALRAMVIFLFNRHRLISWPRYLGHAIVGISAAMLAYRYLILPNISLIPNFETIGNELWLAILAFLYAVANKIPLPNGPGARRRNAFIKAHYDISRQKFGDLIDKKINNNDPLKLLVYSVLVYEDYCRPPAIRFLERIAFWKKIRTTGIMQFSWEGALTDKESVSKGIDKLTKSWEACITDKVSEKAKCAILDYNNDVDYYWKVLDIMEIIAKRSDPLFKKTYAAIYPEEE